MKGYISGKFVFKYQNVSKNYYEYYVEIICTYAPHINSKIMFYFRLSHFFQIPGNVKRCN